MYKRNAIFLLAFLGVCAAGFGQNDPVKKGLEEARRRSGDAPPVLVKTPVTEETPANQPVVRPQNTPGQAPRTINLGGAGGAAKVDPKAPRPPREGAPQPFAEDRKVLSVDGEVVLGKELNDLVAYYHTYRPGSTDLLLIDAVKALLPVKVMQARYGSNLSSMQGRIDEAVAMLNSDRAFEEVEKEYSDDKERPAEGYYVFGRERAVQPFDRLAHSGPMKSLKGPFLTQYGYHILEVIDYQQALEPKDDQTTVRHILVMFPFEGEDPREEIKAAVQGCKIEVLEKGLENIIPPEYRGNLKSN